MSMTYEQRGIEFLEEHIHRSFHHIMSDQLISRIEWLDISSYHRPVAFMEEFEEDFESNLICLFPPFIPEEQ